MGVGRSVGAVALALLALGVTTAARADASPADALIPQVLLGKWKISRILPANTISCWGQGQADAILGTEIEYDEVGFRWNGLDIKSVGVTISTVKADDFHREYSGSGSSVSFSDIGINAPEARHIGIDHVEVTYDDGDSEIPGQSVLLDANDSTKLIFSVCNIYFEADRE